MSSLPLIERAREDGVTFVLSGLATLPGERLYTIAPVSLPSLIPERALQPGEQHWGILKRLVIYDQATRNLVNDAHLAALAIEHGASICTNDKDFTRFTGLKIINPIAKQ